MKGMSRREDMFDDLELVRNNSQLAQLFYHYATLGEAHREAWQARVMQLEGFSPAELVKWHGELIALDWIEQNTGQTPCCYRITFAGLQAFRALRSSSEIDEGFAFPELAEESKAA
jgi:hypothetical protein